MGRALNGEAPLAPKGGARFHFALPGSVQGFQAEGLVDGRSPASLGNTDERLAIHYAHIAPGQPARVFTPTFIDRSALNMSGYGLMACPTLYPGQTVRAVLNADALNAEPALVKLYLRHYAAQDSLARIYGPAISLRPGETAALEWKIPAAGSFPIAEIGLEIATTSGRPGTVHLDSLDWKGAPDAVFTRPANAGLAWKISWVSSVDHFQPDGDSFRLIQDKGSGLLIHGAADWTDYRVQADVTPHMLSAAGLAACVQGLERYYALLLDRDGMVRLVKAWYGQRIEFAAQPFAWEFGQTYQLALEVSGGRIRAAVDGKALFDVTDGDNPLLGGAVALVCEEGRSATQSVRVTPLI